MGLFVAALHALNRKQSYHALKNMLLASAIAAGSVGCFSIPFMAVIILN
jgi:hypothetical protein